MSTTATFHYLDTASAPAGLVRHWGKVGENSYSYKSQPVSRTVHNLRDEPAASEFTTDSAGFALLRWPSAEKAFVDDAAVRAGYYADMEAVLRANCEALASNAGATNNKVRKVVIFDHTIRRPGGPRGPFQQVHVDQTAAASVARVRRHLPAEEADELLKHRFQLINVWRPIGHPATDHPLAVVDWRSTAPGDFVPVDLLFRKSGEEGEKAAVSSDEFSTEGYEARGATMGVAARDEHRFYYVKDMTPEEVLLLKCYDSWGEGEPGGKKGLAVYTPHSAFEDPATPADAKPRESIEVRALVFYEE
ncbi:methyltransferase [Xylaria sp. FL1777]|nr:methyltransferase [Xylaria sp. FL1777]